MDKQFDNTIDGTEEKPDISHLASRMFDENVAFEEEKPIGREYFDAVHHGELKPNTDHIVMTRSMYNKSVAKIQKQKEEEIKDTVKYIPLYIIIVVVLFVLTVGINTVCTNIGLEPFQRLRGGVSAAAAMILPAMVFFFAFSVIKRLKKAKAAEEKAMERLESSKKECMLMGTYDASK